MASTAERLAQYEDLFAKSQQYDPNAFQQDFKKSYGEATNYNQDLIRQQAESLGALQSVAPTLREKYSNSLITDPTAQRALVAQARQTPISDYATASNLLGARGNRLSDILQSALGGYQTSANQAQTAAENAWRMYQDAVSQDQFNRQMSKGSGGSPAFDLSSLFNQPQEVAPVNTGLDITVDVPDNAGANKFEELYQTYAKPIGGNTAGITNNPFTTSTNLIGNLLGNLKQDNMSFIDKLFNRRK